MSNHSDVHLDMRVRQGVSNFDDRIDSRDVVERIEELEAEFTDDEGQLCFADDDNLAEYQALNRLMGELAKVADYEGHARDGMFLTHESHMSAYAAEFYAETYQPFKEYDGRQFKDVEVPWDELMSRLPYSCIDWEQVARVMESESNSVDWDGVTYYVC